jgi:muramoyltetrapeptide carboxypeptidase
MGGNLTTLCHLVGTPFEPEFSGHILFLEDRGEAPYRIDRMLTQMKMALVLKIVAGMILGSFSECGGMSEVIQIFEDCFEDFDFPILEGLK